jgi:sirohydrochlorin ferrochelatase
MLGMLLIDHGSRRPEANAQLSDIAERVRRLAPERLVGIAHLELCAPDIASGFAELVQRGAKEIRVCPYFLGGGRHTHDDIPQHVRAVAERFAQVTWRIAAPLGPHDLLAQLLIERAG